MAKPWGGAGAWAAEAEQADAEAKAADRNMPTDAFPTLGETITSGGKATKKKKPQTYSISEFTVGKYVGPGGKTREMSNSRGLSAEEMMMLPTGPRDRSNEEPESPGGLGGGFSNYGGFRGGVDRSDRDARDRVYGGLFERDRDRDSGRGDRTGRDRDGDTREDGSLRADDSDDWGAQKKAPQIFGLSYHASGGSDTGRREGYREDIRDRGRLSDRDLPSRADEVENWGSSKKFVVFAPGGGGDSFDRRVSRGVGGFEDAFRRGIYDDPSGGISRADEVDDWGAAKKFVSRSNASERQHSGGGFESTYRDTGSDAERWSRREPLSRDEVCRPSERPRLVLQPRTVPVHSSLLPSQLGDEKLLPRSAIVRRETSVPHDAGVVPEQLLPERRPKPRSNPFGYARPREEVLAGKGQDWRKFDADLESKRPPSSHSNRSSRPQTPEMGMGQGLTGSASESIPEPVGEKTTLNSQIDREGDRGLREPDLQNENWFSKIPCGQVRQVWPTLDIGSSTEYEPDCSVTYTNDKRKWRGFEVNEARGHCCVSRAEKTVHTGMIRHPFSKPDRPAFVGAVVWTSLHS